MKMNNGFPVEFQLQVDASEAALHEKFGRLVDRMRPDIEAAKNKLRPKPGRRGPNPDRLDQIFATILDPEFLAKHWELFEEVQAAYPRAKDQEEEFLRRLTEAEPGLFDPSGSLLQSSDRLP